MTEVLDRPKNAAQKTNDLPLARTLTRLGIRPFSPAAVAEHKRQELAKEHDKIRKTMGAYYDAPNQLAKQIRLYGWLTLSSGLLTLSCTASFLQTGGVGMEAMLYFTSVVLALTGTLLAQKKWRRFQWLEQIRSTDWVTHDVAPDLVPREAQRRMQAIQTELPNVHFVQHTLHPDPLIEARLDQELYFIYGWLPSQNPGEILQLTENAGHLVPFPIKND